jgi:hypothetical protein
MANPFKSQNEANEPQATQVNSSDAINLTVQMFFGAEGHNAYFAKQSWLDYGASLRDSEVDDLRKLLQCFGLNMRMQGNSQLRHDVKMRLYAYHQFYKPRASVGVKIIYAHGMERFISDYQDGLIAIGFTLEELTAEARKA